MTAFESSRGASTRLIAIGLALALALLALGVATAGDAEAKKRGNGGKRGKGQALIVKTFNLRPRGEDPNSTGFIKAKFTRRGGVPKQVVVARFVNVDLVCEEELPRPRIAIYQRNVKMSNIKVTVGREEGEKIFSFGAFAKTPAGVNRVTGVFAPVAGSLGVSVDVNETIGGTECDTQLGGGFTTDWPTPTSRAREQAEKAREKDRVRGRDRGRAHDPAARRREQEEKRAGRRAR